VIPIAPIRPAEATPNHYRPNFYQIVDNCGDIDRHKKKYICDQ